MLIANDGPLGPEWLDHPLKGDWEGHRECHIGGDFLLAYKVDDNGKTGMIVFVSRELMLNCLADEWEASRALGGISERCLAKQFTPTT